MYLVTTCHDSRKGAQRYHTRVPESVHVIKARGVYIARLDQVSVMHAVGRVVRD